MKKKNQAVVETYLLVSVKASRQHGYAGVDINLRQFLIEQRFSDITAVNNDKHLTATGGQEKDPVFIVEVERRTPLISHPFFIIRLDDKSRTVVDSGTTIHLPPTGFPGEQEMYAKGDEVVDWTIRMRVAPPELIARNQHLKDNPFKASSTPDAPELLPFSEEALARMREESRAPKSAPPAKDILPTRSIDDPHVQTELQKIVGVEKKFYRRRIGSRSPTGLNGNAQRSVPRSPVAMPAPLVEPEPVTVPPRRPEFPGTSIVFSLLDQLESASSGLADIKPEIWENTIRAEMRRRNMSGVDGINAATHVVTDRVRTIRSSLETMNSAIGFVKRNLLNPKNPV